MEMADDGAVVTTHAYEGEADGRGGGRTLRLRTIVMDNFKNYIGEHTIEIDSKPFVCFFGRNGAGKSCVVDAIAYCLGATPQQLRVKRFAKLVNDSVAAQEPTALASVALCFQADGQKQIWIRRTVDGASSQSKYQYSDTSTLVWKSGSKTSIETALRNYGIDMQLQDRFIIRQANASALAQMSSVQLLHFCERIIGTAHIKDQLSDLNKQWDELSSKCEILVDEITAVDKEAEDCQPMVAKYQDWLEKTEKIASERNSLKTALAVTDHGLVRLYRQDLEQLKKERASKQDEVTRLRAEVESKEAECSEQLKLIHTHQTQALKSMQHLRQLTKTKASLANQLATLQSERNAVQIRAEHFDREKEDVAKATTQLEEQNFVDAASAADFEGRLQEAIKAAAALSSSSTNDGEKEKITEQLVKEIEDVESTLRRAKIVQTNQAKAKTRALESVNRIEREIAKHVAAQSHTQTAVKQLEKSIEQDSKEMGEHQSTEAQLQIMVEKLEADHVLHVRRTAESLIRTKGDVVFNRVRDSLGEVFVRGRLWQLALTESRFADAVNSALQAQLSYVVVQDRRSAIHVSRAFTEAATGRVSCCALDEFDSSFECSRNGCGAGWHDQDMDGLVPLCQALRCSDVAVRRVFHKYARNWVIVRDAEEATAIVKRGRMNCVTLQGDLFYADGSIRAVRKAGNDEASRTMRICSVQESSVAGSGQSAAHESVDPSQNNLADSLAESQAKLSKVKSTVEALKERIDVNRQMLEGLSTLFNQAASSLKVLSDKQEVAQRELEIAQSESSDEIDAQIQSCTERLAALKRSKSKILKSSVSKKRASLLSTQARCQRELAAVKSRVSVNKTSLAKLRVKDQTTTLQQVALRKKAEELDKEVEALQNKTTEIDRELQSATDRATETTEALSTAKATLKALSSEQRRLEESLRKKRSEVKRLLGDEDRMLDKISAVEAEAAHLSHDCAGLDDPMEAASAQKLQDQRLQHKAAVDGVEEEQRVLDSIQSTILVGVIERAIECENQLAKLRDQLQQNRDRLTALSAHQHNLTIGRHKRLMDSLSFVNANFSRIYRLMNEDGDCYLGYSMERSTLFAEGVSLNCKPDESHWQSFLGLSGGQQVVCAVSLMLALQASFPNPFYVCDEIDAALDTLNVKKLAELLRDQSRQTSTQFLVVSHRPEMWEVGKFLVGVYECEKSAHTISCRFE